MSAKEREEDTKISKTLSKIKNRLLVFSGKGGVGKSTVAANLSLAFAMHGLNVGLLDVDIHGPNSAKMLGVEDKRMDVSPEGIKPVNVDWLIIDSPPGTGDEPLSVAQLIPATGAIVVTTPQEVSLMDSRKAVAFARSLKLKILGIIENMSGLTCPHCGKQIDLFKEGGGKKAALELGVPFLGKIPIDPQIVISSDEGKPFIGAYPDSEASKAFMKIVESIIEVKAH